MRPREMRHIRGAQIAMILQDPMASLNPLFSIYRQVMEPAYYHRAMRGRRAARAGARVAERGAHPLAGDADARVSAPDVGRHAAAHRRRDRACRRPEADHRRRADDQSRRDDPGAISRPLARIAGADRGRDHLCHAQSRDRRAHVRQARGHVCRQDRRGRQRAPAVQRRPRIPIRRRCSARCRSSAARKSCSRSRDSRPTSRPCRRAALSIRAVPKPCRSVQ